MPILAAALPALGLAIWLIVEGASEQHDNVYERHELRARTTAFALGQLVRTQLGEVELLAVSPIVTQPGSSEQITRYLAEFQDVNPGWETIAVADADGWVIAGTKGMPFEVNVADRDYFQEAVETGDGATSDPLIERGSGQPTIMLAAPVDFADGSRGALIASLPLDWFHAALVQHVPASSRVQLIHSDGYVFVDPRHREVQPAPGTAARPAAEAAAEAALRGHSGAVRSGVDGEDLLISFAPMPENEWALLLATPAAEAFRHADDRLRTDLALTGVAFGAIIVLSWSFSGRLATAMRRTDEARRRAERARRRAALAAEASKRLSAHDTYEETIPVVASLACAEFGAWCVLELVGEDGQSRQIAVEPGGDRPTPPEVTGAIRKNRASLGRGRALSVAVEDAGDGEPGAALVVPISQAGRLMGWLAFVVPGAREFEEDDVVLVEDLAARAAMAIANAELYRKARESTLAREHVLSVVAHDLKSPLSTIDLSVAALSRGERISDRARRQLERVDRSSKQMQRLIRDLLEAARVDRAALCAHAAVHEVDGVVREAVEIYRPLASEKDIRIGAKADTEAGRAHFDRDRIDQVLGNLLSNAIRFTPPGGEVSLAAGRADGLIIFDVRDSGPGIPPEDLPRIFERFWHGGGGGGTGLGLAIAKAIVEAHGGRIWAESPPGGGARVVFTLPADPPSGQSDDAPAASDRDPERPGAAAADASNPGDGDIRA